MANEEIAESEVLVDAAKSLLQVIKAN